MRIIDRYVIRQILMPFCIGLIVFTFVFIIRTLMDFVEPLIAKGISGWVLARALALLIPQALALSIPMALLLGILVAFGRLSSQREFVALQACGVSLRRLLLPVGVVSMCGWVATSYVMLVAVPESNQAFRELAVDVTMDRAEGEVKPRVFFNDFPGLVLFVRDVPITGGGWNGVFLADLRAQPREVHLARHGEVYVDQVTRTVELRLQDGVRYRLDGAKSEVFRFTGSLDIRINPTPLFLPPEKSEREMSIAELRENIAMRRRIRTSTHNQVMAIHQKFSIPVACLVFGVIGLALGATNRRDSALSSFGLGIAVVFAYYIPLFLFPQMTKGGYLPPWLAVWLPNILLGLFALVLFVRRDRIADQPLGLPAWIRRIQERAVRQQTTRRRLTGPGVGRVLDHYVTGNFVRVLVLTFAAAVAVFYISTFIDLSDKLFKDNSRWYAILEYFFYATPQFSYYILPLSVLIATLVTVGMLTSSSELVAMKACGISLYRATVPMLACAAIVGGLLFALDATVLGQANRRAERLKSQIKGATAWIVPHEPWTRGEDGRIYHIGALDRARPQLLEVDVWTIDPGMSRLMTQTYAKRAIPASSDPNISPAPWRLENGWTRTFDDEGLKNGDYREFASAVQALESVAALSQESPDAEFMSFRELRQHTTRLASSGFDVVEYRVDLARKLAFPFVTVIMTLIAIPFAVTIGRSGTMAGIGVGVALALFYWGAISISVAFGYGGALPPALAAWAPNLLFATGAAYLILTVRT